MHQRSGKNKVLWKLSYATISINENSQPENSYSLFQNPVSDQLYISTTKHSNTPHTIRFFSSDGKLVYEKRLIISQEITTLAVDGLSNGTYTYTLFSKNFNHSGSVIIGR